MFWEFELTNLLNEVVGWVLAVGSSLHFIWGATRILVYNDAETICKLWKMWLHLYSITQDWCEQMSNFVKNVIVLFPGPVWVCPDRRRRGGQRHPQSSAPVKPVRPRPASCLTDCPLPHPTLSYLAFSLCDDDYHGEEWCASLTARPIPGNMSEKNNFMVKKMVVKI